MWLRFAPNAVIAALLLWRVAYHAAYLWLDPFARVTLSDGQVYEEAARDLLAYPPLGSKPFYLQGLYAYVLALGMAVRGALLDGLALQLALAALALWLFWRTAAVSFGPRAAAWSVLLLLACPALAFYENKYLSASLGVLCNVAVLMAFVRLARAPSLGMAVALGMVSGLSILARPNLLFALPFTAVGAWLVTRERALTRPALIGLAVGLALALTPMAARNWLVTGRPSVLASHGGGIPFYIGNGPRANGLWNSAGGLLSGQVMREQSELADQLGIDARGAALHQAIGNELYARAFEFMRTDPLAWLALQGKKLRHTLGNREHVHDFDLLGERELLGLSPPGVPFGVFLGLGALGLHWLWRRAREAPELDERTRHTALLVVLVGQLVAVLLANLVWFTASQHRMPLVVPLALCAGPMLADAVTKTYRPPTVAVIVAAMLGLQAFLPQNAPDRPSAVHYYNLGIATDILGQHPAALVHYRTAAERAPKQPMFALRYARLARRMQRDAEARPVLEGLLARPGLPEDIANAARSELRTLDARAR